MMVPQIVEYDNRLGGCELENAIFLPWHPQSRGRESMERRPSILDRDVFRLHTLFHPDALIVEPD
eukprot:3495491-Rhodomonas_salina.1